MTTKLSDTSESVLRMHLISALDRLSAEGHEEDIIAAGRRKGDDPRAPGFLVRFEFACGGRLDIDIAFVEIAEAPDDVHDEVAFFHQEIEHGEYVDNVIYAATRWLER